MPARTPEPGQSLADLFPEIAAEWDSPRNSLTPHDLKPKSNLKCWWKCAAGHGWQVSVSERTRGTGCPVCAVDRRSAAKRRPKPGRSFAERHPGLVAEWISVVDGDGTPESVNAGSKVRVRWRCGTCRHEWVSTVSNRASGRGCPVCSSRVVVAGVNDLATRFPDIARRWADDLNGDLTPQQVAPNHNRKRWWRCEIGHTWQATPNQLVRTRRTYNSSGCPVCAGQTVLAGYNDLATMHPDLVAEWNHDRNQPLSPSQVAPASHRKVWWVRSCVEGEPPHEWQATIASRRQHGCSVCRGLTVQVGVNDLATVNPLLAAEWHPERNGNLTTRDVTRSSGRRVWWRCEEGHEWTATINSRDGGRGCNSCARFGFVPAADGWVYLLKHHDLEMTQVGITNHPDRRLNEHRRNGWEVLDVRGPMPGDLAAALERDALAALARRGARLGQRGDGHRFDGYTEAWPMSSLRVESLRQLMEWITDDE